MLEINNALESDDLKNGLNISSKNSAITELARFIASNHLYLKKICDLEKYKN